MRQFLALLAAVYLVDAVPYWIAFGAFYWWYDGGTASWGDYAAQLAAALVVGLVMRVFQARRPALLGSWMVAPLQHGENVRNVVISIALVFPGLLGYGDVIELTGSPASDEMWPVGRARSLVMLAMILGGTYAYTKKWKDLLAPSETKYFRANRPLVYRSPPGTSSLRADQLAPSHVVHLGIVMCLVVLGDVFAHANWFLDTVLAGSIVAYSVVLVLFSALWAAAIRTREAYKES